MIPNGVTNIGVKAFYLCTSLTNVTIPGSVTNIGMYAFADCGNLMSVFFEGNAPGIDLTAFAGDNNLIVYPPSGSAGWGAKFGGATTWNPQVQNSRSTFGVHSNQFGFNITGNSNLVVVVQVCTNMFNPLWSQASTNTLTNGTSYFSDPQWTNYPGRYYRLRSL